MTYTGIWYDMNEEKKRDHVEASSVEEATRKLHLMYNGNDPAPMLSVVEGAA